MNKQFSLIFKPETHRILYILLLITTPFLLLQNYMQSLIGELSNLTYNLLGFNIPVTVTIGVIGIITILYFTYKKLNKLRIISWLVIIILFWIGQKSTDYYFNHKFYELQYNWHYFAYSIFAYLNYRVLIKKKVSPQKIVFLTFIYTLAISTFDEAVQIPLSNRIFDIGDISKDLWGSMIGQFFILFILENGKINNNGWKIRHKKIKDYFNSPLSLLIIEFIFAYIFIVFSSLLTSTEYTINTIFISILTTAAIFTVIHLSQNKIWKIVFIVLFAGILITQGFYLNKYSSENIIYYKNKLLIYKGIPIYFFDVLMYPDGSFRLIDKKKVFNGRDKQTILNICENIVIISSGTDGSGGKGFPENSQTQFIFGRETKQGVQVIILENNEACNKFNELRSDEKNPTLIFHNN
ncbi:MAG: VanZ family protein [Bacteroidota bacterium]